jgi:hypothetical protein
LDNAYDGRQEIRGKRKSRFYDTPDEFNNEMQAEACEWLRRWA